jgi:UDP-N-acetylglucosamine transferase subunit ALG13
MHYVGGGILSTGSTTNDLIVVQQDWTLVITVDRHQHLTLTALVDLAVIAVVVHLTVFSLTQPALTMVIALVRRAMTAVLAFVRLTN